jgi:hypothetical protein
MNVFDEIDYNNNQMLKSLSKSKMLNVNGSINIDSNTDSYIKSSSGVVQSEKYQKKNAVAIGSTAGYNLQKENSIAIGTRSGMDNQGKESISIGLNSGFENQGIESIAIGKGAGQYSQGENSIAIGKFAGKSAQHPGSIVFNASGKSLDTHRPGLYISNVGESDDSFFTFNNRLVFYNKDTNEMSFQNNFSLLSHLRNIKYIGWIWDIILIATPIALIVVGLLLRKQLITSLPSSVQKVIPKILSK